MSTMDAEETQQSEETRTQALADDAEENAARFASVPLGVILRNSLDRPWLALYRDRPLPEDAARIAVEHNTLALAAGEEVWLKICSLVGWLDLGRLGSVCSMLQRVTANELCWEPRCLRAWRLRGFQPCAQVRAVPKCCAPMPRARVAEAYPSCAHLNGT